MYTQHDPVDITFPQKKQQHPGETKVQMSLKQPVKLSDNILHYSEDWVGTN